MVMKTFITKLRLSTHPVGKQDKPIKIVWEGLDMSPITFAGPNTWGEPVEYVMNSGPSVYANVSSHDPYIVGSSLQNVSHALAQASVSAQELQQALTRLADISYVDNEVLTSIHNDATTLPLTTAELIENLIHDRLRGII
jgi:hypothetical protein